MVNGHGDDIYNKNIVSNFSSNVYNNIDLSGLDTYLSEHIASIHSYPEPEAESLVESLGKKHDVKPSNVMVTNGATEAIYLIAQTFAAKRSTIVIPTFSEYEDACRINSHQLSFISSLSQMKDSTDLIWICNPNNPTGDIYQRENLNDMILNHPDILFVIDQSYEAFTEKQHTFSVNEGTKYKNVILLHSMIKSYAIPGLRLGYMTACEDIIRKIKAYRMPWSVNGLAIEAGKYLLEKDKSTFDLKACLSETNRFMTTLNGIDGIKVFPTNTHFFLCELSTRKASDLKQYLIEVYGMLIRDASNFRGLNERYFRIATQTPDENEMLIKAIKEWM